MGDMYSSSIIHQGMVSGLKPGGSVGSPTYHDHRIESGSAVASADGVRMVYSAGLNGIVYVQVTVTPGSEKQLGAFYDQSVFGFERDTGKLAGTAGRVSVNLAATKSVISDFLDVYKGVLSVAGGPLALSITGMDMLVTAGTIKRNYSTYREAAVELVVANKYCRTEMPVFYRTVLEKLFFGAIQDKITKKTDELLLEAIPDKKLKLAGEMVGVFVGKARGDGQFKRNLNLVKDLLNEVVLKVADHITDKGGSLSGQQVNDLARHHVVKILGTSGVPIDITDAEEIVRETAANAISIRTMFRKLIKAIDAA